MTKTLRDEMRVTGYAYYRCCFPEAPATIDTDARFLACGRVANLFAKIMNLGFSYSEVWHEEWSRFCKENEARRQERQDAIPMQD